MPKKLHNPNLTSQELTDTIQQTHKNAILQLSVMGWSDKRIRDELGLGVTEFKQLVTEMRTEQVHAYDETIAYTRAKAMAQINRLLSVAMPRATGALSTLVPDPDNKGELKEEQIPPDRLWAQFALKAIIEQVKIVDGDYKRQINAQVINQNNTVNMVQTLVSDNPLVEAAENFLRQKEPNYAELEQQEIYDVIVQQAQTEPETEISLDEAKQQLEDIYTLDELATADDPE